MENKVDNVFSIPKQLHLNSHLKNEAPTLFHLHVNSLKDTALPGVQAWG